MTNEEAYRILAAIDEITVKDDEIYSPGHQFLLAYTGEKEATLDGEFTADDLEAIAQWMRDPAGVAAAGGGR